MAFGRGLINLDHIDTPAPELRLRSVDDPGASIPRWQVAMMTVRQAERGDTIADDKRPILTNSLQRKLFQEKFEKELPQRSTDRATAPARPYYRDGENHVDGHSGIDAIDPFTIPSAALPFLFMLMTLGSILAVTASVVITAYGLSSPAF